MAWTTLSSDDIRRGIGSHEFDAFLQIAVDDNELTADEIVAGLLSDVTENIRGAVATSGKYTLGPEGQIPRRLRRAARALLVMDVMSRPGASIIDDDNNTRAKAAAAAELLLERVADGDYRIEGEDGGEVSQRSIYVSSKSTRHASRNNLKGL